MANYSKIIEHYPEMADFRVSELMGWRGDVLSYRAGLTRGAFTTDEQGFRHSTFNGKPMSVVDCLRSDRYGILLGPSTFFGSGIAGNEHIMASLLAERFGFPFANAAMPGGNSRNLHALLVGLVAGAKQPPAVVVLSTGGDLANFCEAATADPIFGSPNRMQIKAGRTFGQVPTGDGPLQSMLVFTTLWTTATVTLCRAYKSSIVLVHQSTFFEKTKPSRIEQDCALGQPGKGSHDALFTNFRQFNAPFFAKREEIAKRLGIPLAGVGISDRLTFMDEFHCTREATRILSEDVGDKIEPLLTGSSLAAKPPAKAKKPA
ncbi:MAG: hypothetical protein ABIS23_01405 [Sphingomicrobium sp.]